MLFEITWESRSNYLDNAMGQLANFGDRTHFQLEVLETRTLFSVQTFAPPTPSQALQSETVGRDGSLYFVEADQQQIGRIMLDGNIIEYTVPDNFGDIGQLTTAKDGSIWFNTVNADSPLLGHLTTNGRVTSVALYNDAISIGAANDGTIWFSTVENGIGRVNTKNRVSYYGGTDPSGYVTKIISGPSGSIYFAEVSKSSDPSTTPYLFSVHQATGLRRVRFSTFYSGNTTYNFDNIGDIAGSVHEADNMALNSHGSLVIYDGITLQYINPYLNFMPSPGTLIPIPAGVHVGQINTGPDGEAWYVDAQGGKLNGTLDLPPDAGAPYTVVAGSHNVVWVTDGAKGVIYKVYVNEGDTNSDLTGLGGYPSFGRRGILDYVHLSFSNYTSIYDTFQVLRSSSINGKYSVVGSVSGGTGSLRFDDSHVQLHSSYYYKLRSTVFNMYLDGPLKVTADYVY
jgi:hypothetical protein